MSRSRVVLTGVALALLVAACGPGRDDGQPGVGGSPATGGGGSPQAGEVSGEIFAYGQNYEVEADTTATARIDYVLEQYPDLEVTFSESGFEDEGFLTALQTDEPPDVVRIPRDKFGTYMSRGVLEPLDSCLEQQGVDIGIYYDGGVSQVTGPDGTIYGIPEFFDTRNWIIDNVVFEEAGLDPETFDFSDWDAIAAANEELTIEGERIGIDPKLPEFLPMWVRANGGRMLSDDGLESLLDTPEVAEALEFTAGLHEPFGGRAPFLDFRDSASFGNFFGEDNMFVLHTPGAFPMEQWYLNVLAEVSPDVEITVRPFVDREGNPMTLSGGSAWAVVAGTDNPDAACAFVTTLNSTDSWVIAAEARKAERDAEGLPYTGTYTGNREADEVIFGEIVDLSEFPTFQEAVRRVVENQENAFGLPPSPAGAAFQQAWQTAVDNVLTGGQEPAEALQAADEEAQSEIDAAAR